MPEPVAAVVPDLVAACGGPGRGDRGRIERASDCGYRILPRSEDGRAAAVLKDEGYKFTGNAPVYALLRDARDRAKDAGATHLRGAGGSRRPGSVPANISRHAKTDVLIVHTT